MLTSSLSTINEYNLYNSNSIEIGMSVFGSDTRTLS